jgi:hypothetical protein
MTARGLSAAIRWLPWLLREGFYKGFDLAGRLNHSGPHRASVRS